MSHIITWDDDIKNVSNKFKNNRKIIIENTNKINERIKNETFFEKKEIEKAISKYNKKIEKIMSEKEMTNYSNIVKEKSKENFELAQKAFQYYQSKLEQIQKSNLSMEQKINEEKNLLLAIGNNLLSDDARQKFQTMIENSDNENMILLI